MLRIGCDGFSFFVGMGAACFIIAGIARLGGLDEDVAELKWWRETHQQEYLDKVRNERAKELGFKTKE